MSYIQTITPALLQGAIISLELFALTLIFSLPLGLPIALGENSKLPPLRWFCKVYVLVFRGTPLMLQLFFFYYFFPICLNIRMDAFPTAVITFALNYAAYFAEIYRGGIQSIPFGQYEAAKVLGFTKNQTFFRIIIPQVVKRIIPPMGNEVITLVKDTALVQVLGVAELFHVAQTQSGRLVSVMPLFIAGVFYFIMNWVVSKAFDFTEKKLGYYK